MKSPFKGKFIMQVDEKGLEDEMLMQYKLLQRADEKIDPFAKYYFQNGDKEFMNWDFNILMELNFSCMILSYGVFLVFWLIKWWMKWQRYEMIDSTKTKWILLYWLGIFVWFIKM